MSHTLTVYPRSKGPEGTALDLKCMTGAIGPNAAVSVLREAHTLNFVCSGA